MLGKIKLSFLEDLNLGDVCSVSGIEYSCEQRKYNVDIDIYWKQQHVYFDVKLKNTLFISIVFNKQGVLEYSFAHVKDVLVFAHIQAIISLLNNNFSKLNKKINKMRLSEESNEAFPPYVFVNEKCDLESIYYNKVDLQIVDLDLNAIYIGHIIRKHSNLYYVVQEQSGEIISLLKLKLKNDNWYYLESYFKDTIIEPSLLLNSFYIPVGDQVFADEAKNISNEKLKETLLSLNIYI